MVAFFGAGWGAVREGALDVMEPAAGFGEVFEAFAVEGCFEGSAIGVAAEDGVFDFEDFDGVLDGGGDSVDVAAADGDDVAGVAGDEEVAGPGLQDEVRDDAGVGAGDEEPLRSLHLGEEMELFALTGKYVGVEFAMTGDKFFHVIDCGEFFHRDIRHPLHPSPA